MNPTLPVPAVAAPPPAPACLVCGMRGRRKELLGGLLLRCRGCEFTWTAAGSAPPEELYDAGYYAGDGYEDYFLATPRRFEARLRLGWLDTTGRPASLIEAGSAGGFFVAAARADGIDAQGVEVSATAVRYARERLGVPVHHGQFEQATFAGPVEAVCAFHVLEHVTDPNDFLRAAWRNLAPGGRLAIEVPNIGSAAAVRLGTAWPGLQPRYHRWHFTPHSLRQLVTSHGFEVLRQDTAVFRFYMPARYRRRQARHTILPDLRHLGSLRLTHPTRADLIRLIARRPATRSGLPVLRLGTDPSATVDTHSGRP